MHNSFLSWTDGIHQKPNDNKKACGIKHLNKHSNLLEVRGEDSSLVPYTQLGANYAPLAW